MDDGPVAAALQDDGAPEVLELWQLHSQNMGEVDKNEGKGKGTKVVTKEGDGCTECQEYEAT